MRRLQAQQHVAVVLDDESEEIDCTVGSVAGPVATLTYRGALTPTLSARLTPGSLAFLVFEHRGMPVALRGAAGADVDSATIEFVVLDGVQVDERRTIGRVPLVIPVRVTPDPVNGDTTDLIETVSVNLSPTGALIERRPGLTDGSPWKVELVVPSPEEPIRCQAKVARQTPTHIGIAFSGIEDAEQARLDAILRAR